jgi:hypothetical protein
MMTSISLCGQSEHGEPTDVYSIRVIDCLNEIYEKGHDEKQDRTEINGNRRYNSG